MPPQGFRCSLSDTGPTGVVAQQMFVDWVSMCGSRDPGSCAGSWRPGEHTWPTDSDTGVCEEVSSLN